MARWPFFALFLAAALAIPMASASAQPEIRISRTTTMAYLPLMLVEAEKLLQKHAAAAGIPDLKVSIHTFTGPSAQFDALFSGNVDVVAVGSTALITLWAKTKGTANEVKGVSAMSSMPIALSTRNPQVKSIRDFTDKDRIAVPSVNVSFQAMLLEMAAAKEWGAGELQEARSSHRQSRADGCGRRDGAAEPRGELGFRDAAVLVHRARDARCALDSHHEGDSR